jgi:hypothetical protein
VASGELLSVARAELLPAISGEPVVIAEVSPSLAASVASMMAEGASKPSTAERSASWGHGSGESWGQSGASTVLTAMSGALAASGPADESMIALGGTKDEECERMVAMDEWKRE